MDNSLGDVAGDQEPGGKSNLYQGFRYSSGSVGAAFPESETVGVYTNRDIAGPASLSVSSNLVLIDVSVLDRNGRPVRGLHADSFRLFEHGEEQRILSVSEADVPVSVVIVFDESGSMGNAVRRCASALRLFLKGSSNADEFALISFATHVVVESDFTRDTGTIEARLLPGISQGRTPLLDAIQRAVVLVRHAHNQRRIILVLTDGGDNYSHLRLTDLRRNLLETDAQLYAISVSVRELYVEPNGLPVGPDLLELLCTATGGRSIGIDDIPNPEEALRQVNDEIRSEYVLAYKPRHLKNDGKFHPVSLKFKPPPGIREPCLTWRRGYYDRIE